MNQDLRRLAYTEIMQYYGKKCIEQIIFNITCTARTYNRIIHNSKIYTVAIIIIIIIFCQGLNTSAIQYNQTDNGKLLLIIIIVKAVTVMPPRQRGRFKKLIVP